VELTETSAYFVFAGSILGVCALIGITSRLVLGVLAIAYFIFAIFHQFYPAVDTLADEIKEGENA